MGMIQSFGSCGFRATNLAADNGRLEDALLGNRGTSGLYWVQDPATGNYLEPSVEYCTESRSGA